MAELHAFFDFPISKPATGPDPSTNFDLLDAFVAPAGPNHSTACYDPVRSLWEEARVN